MKLQEKRIYEDYSPSDGYRVLVDRLWPRGVSKEEAHLDIWAKDIAPSTEIREKFHQGIDSYQAFSAAYTKELEANPDAPEFVQNIKKHEVVTLLTAVKDMSQSHVPIIMNYIEKQEN